MAWKRGTQNNIPGEIRKGHIREFLFPPTKGASSTEKLLIVDAKGLILSEHCTAAFISLKIPANFSQFADSGSLFIHSHEHPNSVLKVIQHACIPEGCIALNETQRINSKVCVGELQEWTVYQGDSFAYDAREGAIGDTTIRQSAKLPSLLHRVVLAVRPRYVEKRTNDGLENGIDIEIDSQSTKTKTQNEASPDDCRRRVEIDTLTVIKQYTALLHDCIISLEDVYTTQFQSVQIVGRVADLLPVIKSTDDDYDEHEEAGNAVEDYEVAETYRGIVGIETEFYLILENSEVNWTLLNSPVIPPLLPHKDLINVYTKDNEHFPVLRRLLRPCISLTSTVQKGKGIYDDTKHSQIKNLNNRITSDNTFNIHQDTEVLPSVQSDNNTEISNGNIVDVKNGNKNENVVPLIIISYESESENGVSNDRNDNVTVEVDACTFDKVLLYLEHEARGDAFKFDPLLAPELREASLILGVKGLQDVCDKVLGSFQERVRRTPIRLSEVIARNHAGTAAHKEGNKRSETLLLLDGMVLDISRWIEEHPGGSSIIPEQALNVDSTVFFEIYHASKQSFLYLKEFYIGELAEEDALLVPSTTPDGVRASDAFLEQLKALTKWRLLPADMILYKNQKSF